MHSEVYTVLYFVVVHRDIVMIIIGKDSLLITAITSFDYNYISSKA